MIDHVKIRKTFAATLVLLGCASILPTVAGADPKEVRHEVRRELDHRHSPPAPGYHRGARYYYADGRYHDSSY